MRMRTRMKAFIGFSYTLVYLKRIERNRSEREVRIKNNKWKWTFAVCMLRMCMCAMLSNVVAINSFYFYFLLFFRFFHFLFHPTFIRLSIKFSFFSLHSSLLFLLSSFFMFLKLLQITHSVCFLRKHRWFPVRKENLR